MSRRLTVIGPFLCRGIATCADVQAGVYAYEQGNLTIGISEKAISHLANLIVLKAIVLINTFAIEHFAN